jgi:hypothetical protein
VFPVHHVNEIDGNQPSKIPQPKLPGDFLGGFKVGLEGRVFHILFVGGPSGIDVDGDHRFRRTDDDGSAGFELHPFLVDFPDLLLEVVAAENGQPFLVLLDHPEIPGDDGLAVGPHLAIGVDIVHLDFFNF